MVLSFVEMSHGPSGLLIVWRWQWLNSWGYGGFPPQQIHRGILMWGLISFTSLVVCAPHTAGWGFPRRLRLDTFKYNIFEFLVASSRNRDSWKDVIFVKIISLNDSFFIGDFFRSSKRSGIPYWIARFLAWMVHVLLLLGASWRRYFTILYSLVLLLHQML